MANNEKRSFVKNAADPDQVRSAAEKEKSLREREINDMAVVLSSPEGRRLMWRILAHCKTFNSVWAPSAQIHYFSGMQDVGHFLMAEIVEADPNALVDMMVATKDN